MSGISEENRVEFTKRLKELRDSDISEIAFSPNLTSDERKFVHKIAQEFGLKSKSQGKDEKRFITVLKKKNNATKIAGSAPVLWHPHNSTVQALLDPAFQNVAKRQCKQQTSAIKSTNIKSSESKHALPTRDYSINIEHYNNAQQKRLQHKSYHSIQRKRGTLPAAHYRTAVCNLLKEHQIVLISGETGCGKSTQVPQFLLDDPDIGPHCRIAITQPRRISAVAVAERIASERCENIGTTVGYNIRLDSAKSVSTQVLFMTPGVLLRKLLTDPLLLEYTHIVVDEAHERDRFTEFLQIILRDICSRRRDLKLVLMSATMHTDKIRAYFGDIPQLNVGGSVFPVQEYFLEHALMFTHFASCVENRAVLANISHIHHDHDHRHTASHPPVPQIPPPLGNLSMHSKLNLASQHYYCVLCGGGPFESPEELGTHSADCYPGAKAKHPATPAPPSMSRLDALAASINAIRLSNATHTAPTPALSNARSGSHLQSSASPDSEAMDQADIALDAPAQLVDEELATETCLRRARSESEDEAALHSALLTQYQNNWDDSQVDCDLIFALLKYVFSSAFGQQGSVLVFLPGWDDISRMMRMLASSAEFSDSHRFLLLQLHSGIQKKEQDQVFHALRPRQHKIILSTNIAETSITIDDVTVVINAGRVKEKTYDPHTKLAFLQSAWISQASARQRRGRAGRTQAGVCFHLYSTLRSQNLSEFQDSELLRMPLEELVLQAKVLGVAPGEGEAADSVTAFLLKAMDPPHALSISNALTLLQSINCLDQHEQLTPIGSIVSQLPLNPRMGRMILLGCLLGCGPSALATAAAMGYRDPFILPATEQQRVLCNRAKSRLGANVASDQQVVLRALAGFSSTLKREGMTQARRYCEDHYLAFPTMQYLDEMVVQLQQLMRDVNVQVHQARNLRNDGNHALVQGIVSIGLYPDVGIRKKGVKLFSTERACKTKIHPSSVNARLPAFRKEATKPLEVIGFQDLIASQPSPGGGHYIGGASLLMLNTTPLSVFGLLIACGRIEEVSTGEENEELKSELHVEVEVDGWLSLQMHRDHLQMVYGARQLLTTGLEEFLRGANKGAGGKGKDGGGQDKNVARATECLVEVLALEQQFCCSLH